MLINGKAILYNKSNIYPGSPGEINGVALDGKIGKKKEKETSIIIENHHVGTLWLIAANPETSLSILLSSFDAKYEPSNNPIITMVIYEEVNNKIV